MMEVGRRPRVRPLRAAAAGLAVCAVLQAACGLSWLCGGPAPAQRQLRVARAAGQVNVPGDIKNGVMFLVNDDPVQVVSFESKKIGKGVAKTSMKVKNVLTGSQSDVAYTSGTKLDGAETEKTKATYSYNTDDGTFVFMDSETFEEIFTDRDCLGEYADWITEGMQVELTTYLGKVIGITFMEEIIMTVADVSGGKVRADASTQITLENGVVMTAPSYLKVGDRVQISARYFNFQKRIT